LHDRQQIRDIKHARQDGLLVLGPHTQLWILPDRLDLHIDAGQVQQAERRGAHSGEE